METPVSQKRWHMLTLYCALDFLNGLSWTTLISVAPQASKYFDLPEFYVTLYESIFFVLFVINAPLNWWLLSRGFYSAFLVAWVFNFLGSWLKFFAGNLYYLSLLGQGLIASVGGMVVPGCGALVYLYFPPEEHLLATSIASLSNFFGISIGLVLPLYLSIQNVMLFQAVYASVFALAYIVLSDNAVKKIEHKNFLESWKLVYRSYDLFVLMLSNSANIGVSYTLLGLFGTFFYEYGYPAAYVGWIGMCFVICSIIGALFLSLLIRVYNDVQLFRTVTVLSVACLAAWILLFSSTEFCLVLCALTGATFVGIIPLQLRLTVNLDPKLPESIVINIVYYTAESWSVVLTFAFEIIESNSKGKGKWMLLGVTCIASYLSFNKVKRNDMITRPLCESVNEI